MKRFTCPFIVKGTSKEFEAICTELISLGYMLLRPIKTVHEYLFINYNNISANVASFSNAMVSFGTVGVPASNKDLVLALAAMTDEETPQIGEYVKCIDGQSSYFTKNKLYKVIGDFDNFEALIDDTNTPNGYSGQNEENFIRATRQEIIDHFLPTKETTMENAKVTVSENQKETRKIIGYNVKDGIDRKAAARAVQRDSFLRTYSCDFLVNSPVYIEAEITGVLGMLFEPVYEEEAKVFTLDSDDGKFEIEVSEKGIYYRKENIFLNAVELKAAVNPLYACSSNVGTYKFRLVVTHIDSGCKKNVPLKQWQEVLYHFYNL